jgi:hypothetical protein
MRLENRKYREFPSNLSYFRISIRRAFFYTENSTILIKIWGIPNEFPNKVTGLYRQMIIIYGNLFENLMKCQSRRDKSFSSYSHHG